jgi:hypothetical protein
MDMAAAAPASQERCSVSGGDAGRAAEAMRLAWGAAYDIGFADGAWHACRLDGDGYLITSTTPDRLNAAIRADWLARSTP